MSETPRKNSTPIRVAVVDDHPVVRDGLRLMLDIAGKGEFALAGEAADGAASLRMIEEMQPDVVLMDLLMPGMDGIEAIEQIRQRWPHISVVILTTYNEDALMLRALHAGACGYLLKDANRETMFHALRTAARGETLLQPDMMARLLSYTTSIAESSHTTPASAAREQPQLTERECAILAGVARGERSKEIARRLGITPRTVTAHLTSIFNKLNVDSRAAAVAAAIEQGLLLRQQIVSQDDDF